MEKYGKMGENTGNMGEYWKKCPNMMEHCGETANLEGHMFQCPADFFGLNPPISNIAQRQRLHQTCCGSPQRKSWRLFPGSHPPLSGRSSSTAPYGAIDSK